MRTGELENSRLESVTIPAYAYGINPAGAGRQL